MSLRWCNLNVIVEILFGISIQVVKEEFMDVDQLEIRIPMIVVLLTIIALANFRDREWVKIYIIMFNLK